MNREAEEQQLLAAVEHLMRRAEFQLRSSRV
ncbi:MAG: hypothetical protein MHMPM18_005228 [Marteilia pararefringens]